MTYELIFQLYYHFCREEAEREQSHLPGIVILERTKENWKIMPEDSKVVWIELAQKEEEKYRVRAVRIDFWWKKLNILVIIFHF